MVLDYVIVAVVVAGAVAYLAWTFRPRRAQRTATPACSGCAQSSAHKQSAPVRTRWTG
jgi:hypothetical protein